MSWGVDKSFAYKVFKEGLLDEYNINVEDQNLLDILQAGAGWDKGALQYLENSTEIKELMAILQGVSDTYTPETFDKIQSYLKNNPEHCDGFYFAFNDFYEHNFSELIHYLQHSVLQLQCMDDILYLIHCISKRRNELKKIDFPQGHNELTFVVKVTFDLEDGALVYQVLMWKTQDVDAELPEISDVHEDDLDDVEGDTFDEKEFNAKQEPFTTEQFISIWSKRTCDKSMVLIILRNMSYGDSLFKVFGLEESAIH